MGESQYAVSIDDHAGWHASDFETLRKRALRIELHGKVGLVLLQKLLGVGAIVIQIDGHNGKSPSLVGIFHGLHPGKGLPTRGAPGGPEIQINYTPAKTA
jgi:hypothetical protein